MSRYSTLSLLLGVVACGPRTATVRVTIPDLTGVETPIPEMVVTFLPYNRDSILGRLEAKAAPRPHTRELDSLFRAFRGPFVAFLQLSDAVTKIDRARDSLRAKLPAGTADRDSLVKALSDSARRLESRVALARAALATAREKLGPAIDGYRAMNARWEDSTYRDYRSEVRRDGRRAFANPVADTTDPLGWATITITNGDWWATATSIDPGDPNAEWYWNVKIDRDTVHLDPRTGRHRPRY